MKKSQKDKHFVHAPVLEGGDESIGKIIGENIRYPEAALAQRVEGTVSLNYTIGGNGRVIRAEVTEGIGHGCDEEALRLVKLLRFSVKRTQGLNVYHHRTLQIHFKLPPPPKPVAPPSMQVQYQLTPAKPEAAPKDAQAQKPTSPKPSFTYTIQ